MDESELADFVTRYVQPDVLDVVDARRRILERLSGAPIWSVVTSEELVNHISRAMAQDPFPTPAGYISLTPDLNEVKARMAVREALQVMCAEGSIVAVGAPASAPGPEQQAFSCKREHSSGGLPNTSVYLPLIHYGYRLSTRFQGNKFRLASGDVYLSYLDRSQLTSRATRCMEESVNAFRHGLYLSATMNLGAASENLWMELGRLTHAKTGHAKLGDELNKPYPAIGIVIDRTWDALINYADAELRTVFATTSERSMFKVFADRLRDRRNYATHSDDAGIDEPLFTYNETGMLLLDAAEYLNRLLALTAALRARP